MIARYFYDPTLAAGQWFARILQGNGVDPIGATGDWTPVWLREIDPIWREAPQAIAGMTPHGPMFMLENIAHRHGMRLVYSANLIERAGACGIGVQGVQSIVESCAIAARSPQIWAEQMADSFMALTGLEAERAMRVQHRIGVPANPMEDAVHAWIIAPVKGAARYI